MWIWLPLPLVYVALVLLLRAEGRISRDEREVKRWKSLATALVILVCGLSFTHPAGDNDTTYTLLILTGLALSLAGDVLLVPQDNPRSFLSGLVAFFCAHLMYIGAFVHMLSSLAIASNWAFDGVAAAALVLIGGVIYAALRPGLGKLRLPVIAYMVVISAMVHRAVAIAWVHPGPGMQPTLVVVGALLFYLSDVILGINKFRLAGRMRHYRLLNLSSYYTGQLLIALSASVFN